MNIQIGVIGSMSPKLGKEHKQIAARIGHELASHGAILLFGYEGDEQSLPFIAATEAHKNGGQTIAFLWNSSLQCPWGITIDTGADRGGGREFSFIRSCDTVISIGGGSGTLMEITMAYQARIPVVTVKGSGGWSEKVAGSYLDDRRAQIICVCIDAKQAATKAVLLAERKKKGKT